MIDRRDFIKTTALVSAGSLLGIHETSAGQAMETKIVAIQSHAQNTLKTRHAVRELSTGIHMLNPALDVKPSGEGPAGALHLDLRVERSQFKGVEEYEIGRTDNGAVFRAASEQALLFAV